MAPQKGKQGTKGAKQIVEENLVTLNFYRNMIIGSSVIYFVLMAIHSDGFGASEIGFFIFALVIFSASIQFMKFMSKPSYSDSENKHLVDSGVDLNMEAGVAEHIKDIIILTCTALVLSYFSKWFWLLWLLVPLKGAYYAWSKLISPWVFAPGPEPTAQDEKKARKLDRRMRHQ